MTHPLVLQLRFTRSEFQRGLKGLGDAEARQRMLPMNCISWNIGHLAWQEQRYWLFRGQDMILLPELNELVGSGCPPAPRPWPRCGPPGIQSPALPTRGWTRSPPKSCKNRRWSKVNLDRYSAHYCIVPFTITGTTMARIWPSDKCSAIRTWPNLWATSTQKHRIKRKFKRTNMI
jgi:hypothetical protein